MRGNRHPAAIVTPALLAAGLTLLAWLGCGRSALRADRDLVAGIDPDLARSLLSDDDSTFARRAHEAGFLHLNDAYRKIWNAVPTRSAAAFRPAYRRAQPLLARVAAALAREHGVLAPEHDDQILAALPPDTAWAIRSRFMEGVASLGSGSRPCTEKTPLLEAEVRTTAARGLESYALYWEMLLSQCYRDQGDRADQERLLQRILIRAQRAGSPVMACQALGILGFTHFEAGQVDSMRACYDQAYALALRHRLPEQVGRILSFYASYYQGEGRLALAHELYLSARELCRAYKGGQAELRYLDRLAEFHADLGSWRAVSNLLEQARLLLGQRRELSALDYAQQSLNTRLLQARLLMSRGAVDSAETLFREIDAAYSQVPYQQPRARAQLQRCRGLLDNGRCAAALAVAQQGLRLAREQHLPLAEARFQLLLAEGRLALDEPELAGEHLRGFAALASRRPEALREEWMQHDVFDLRRCLQGPATPAERIAALGKALNRLESCLGQMDPSVQSYLLLESCDRLRLLVHDVLAGDPRRGYVFELAWRRLPARLGQRASVAVSPAAVSWWRGAETLEDVVDRWILRCGTTMVPGEGDGDGLRKVVHVLYLVRGDGVLRWTRTAAGVRREPLPVAPRELERRVARSVGILSREPATPAESWSSGADEDLRVLARLLLPPECQAPVSAVGTLPLLLISADACLSEFPFETLLVSGPDGHEAPLLARMDVAYLRFAERRRATRARGPAVVVARPTLPERLRGHPGLGDLPNSEREANLAMAAFPGARLLEGTEATKQALTGLWEQAPVIYLAAHLVRDPEVPYVTFVPLAPAAAGDSLADTYLDLTDIRRSRLEGCRLVVLSTCSSGAPYVEGSVVAPSLGDAFLDAGAAAVVQTFWHVEDEVAGGLMSRFLQEVGFAGRHPVQALGSARRAFLTGDQGLRHPFYWASYAVQLTDLDDLGGMMSAAGGKRRN